MSAPRRSEDVPKQEEQDVQTGVDSTTTNTDTPSLNLPDIPTTDLVLDFSEFIDPNTAAEATEKLQKRASTVMKLAEENEKLKAELKAMSDRLEEAERRRKQLMRTREQRALQEPSS